MGIAEDVALLHRRLGYGADAETVARDAEAGWDATVDRIVATLTTPVRPADAVALPPLVPAGERAPKGGEEAQAIAAWWVHQMVATKSPAQERLLWFWHGHFATSIRKVKSAAQMIEQHQRMRAASAGPFPALVTAAVKTPAMLVWLDQERSTKQDPNENLARELLELFTLGRDDGYGEDDVEAAARALTGWSVDRATGGFVERPATHDPGPVTLLGTTGSLDGDDVVSLAANHPATARYLAWTAWCAFAGPIERSDPLVLELAKTIDLDRRSGVALVSAVVRHERFRSAATTDAIVRDPVTWCVAALRALAVPLDDATTKAVATALRSMGQVPFAPPSVGGWPAGAAWLTTGAAAARFRLAGVLAKRADLRWLESLAPPARPLALAQRLGRTSWSSSTTAALGQVAARPIDVATLALVAPEVLVA